MSSFLSIFNQNVQDLHCAYLTSMAECGERGVCSVKAEMHRLDLDLTVPVWLPCWCRSSAAYLEQPKSSKPFSTTGTLVGCVTIPRGGIGLRSHCYGTMVQWDKGGIFSAISAIFFLGPARDWKPCVYPSRL